MDWQIRVFDDKDLDEIVGVSLLAWEPVFASFRQILGPKIYSFLYPDWRESQKEGVEAFCKDRENTSVLVAELDGKVVGFVAYQIRGQTGEVELLAVHPDYQSLGIGTGLNKRALEEMKAAGVVLVEVGTGGDESHAPARRTYEKSGYTPLPLVRYYKRL